MRRRAFSVNSAVRPRLRIINAIDLLMRQHYLFILKIVHIYVMEYEKGCTGKGGEESSAQMHQQAG